MVKKRARAALLLALGVFFLLALAGCGGDKEEQSKSHTVGIVSPNPFVEETLAAMKTELAARGFTEGVNITYYQAVNPAELSAQVDTDQLDLLVVAGGTFSGAETNVLTQSKALADGKIPIIVMPGSGDPLKAGDVESITHPGKNITGLLLLSVDVKRFEYFADMLPDADQVAVVYDPSHDEAVAELSQIEALADDRGIQLMSLPVAFGQPESSQEALASIPEDIDGVFLLKVWGTSLEWFQWAYERGIPTSQDGRYELPMPQPLMVYGPEAADMGTRGANFIAQVLNGVKPGDLPMEYTEAVLMVDLGIASGMGFAVPDATVGLASVILDSDPTLYFEAQAVEAVEDTPAHASGSGACAATQVSMGGSFSACITLPCAELLDSGVVRYEGRTDVAACSTDGLVGTCATASYDMNYYEGDPAALQMGCGFMTGKWSEPAG